MATRRDFAASAEILRSTPLPDDLRQALASRFADFYDGSAIPGYERDKFMHEATRGTRSADAAPTVNLRALTFTPGALRADWIDQVSLGDMDDAEYKVLSEAPDQVLWSSLAEAVDANQTNLDGVQDTVFDDATDVVIRKIKKFYSGR